jgi:CO dehydrogenase maturation factor
VRIAVAGKGGAGKTTVSATLARLYGRAGYPVIAIDADPNPNLAIALGVADGTAAAALPPSVVSRRLVGPALRDPVTDVLRSYGTAGPDGTVLVTINAPDHAGEGCLCSSHSAVAALLADLAAEGEQRVVLVDMEASPEHLARGTAADADVMLLVTEPYYRSLETTARLASLAAQTPIGAVQVVANKIRSQADAEAVGEFCQRHGLGLAAEVPWSDGVAAADRAARPLIDAFPDDPAVRAIAGLVADLNTPPARTGPARPGLCRANSRPFQRPIRERHSEKGHLTGRGQMDSREVTPDVLDLLVFRWQAMSASRQAAGPRRCSCGCNCPAGVTASRGNGMDIAVATVPAAAVPLR